MNLGSNGTMLHAGTTYTLDLGGQRGIPAAAKSLSLNVTVVRPTANGTITVSACGTSPNVASITYASGKTVASGMQVKMSPNGEICFKASTDMHLVVDVTGWWN
jgi:hypothetical protein